MGLLPSPELNIPNKDVRGEGVITGKHDIFLFLFFKSDLHPARSSAPTDAPKRSKHTLTSDLRVAFHRVALPRKMVDTANGNTYNAELQRARYVVLRFLDAGMVKST